MKVVWEDPAGMDIASTNSDKGASRVMIPQGTVGHHALFTILENVLRNAAIHGDPARIAGGQLTLVIRVADPDVPRWKNDYWELRIRESFTDPKSASELRRRINEDPIFDPVTREMAVTSWGLKEMKIAAAFLRNVAPWDVDEVCRRWNQSDSHEPPLLSVTTTNGEISYRLFLRKPKTLLVSSRSLSPDKKTQEQLWSPAGIDFVDSCSNLRKMLNSTVGVPHDLVLFDPKSCSCQLGCLTRISSSASRLLVVIDGTTSLPASAVGVSRAQLESGEHQTPDVLLTVLWRTWVRARYPASLRLCLRWNRNNMGPLGRQLGDRLVPLTAASINKDEDVSERILLLDDGGEDLPDGCDSGSLLVFDHRGIKGPDENVRDAAFYSTFSSTDGDGRQIATHGQSRYAMYALQECAAATVAVLDERIYRHVQVGYLLQSDKVPDDNRKKIGYVWNGRRVNLDLDPADAVRNFREFVARLPLPKDVFVTPKTPQGPPPVVRYPRGYQDSPPYDFFVVHQRILDEARRNIGQSSFQEAWTELQQKARVVVVNTGRGKPDAAREKNLHLPWIEYSNLSSCIVTGDHSKIRLVQMLFAARPVHNGS